jgi:polyphosphate kinase
VVESTREAGVHVVYGLPRPQDPREDDPHLAPEGDALRRYAHNARGTTTQPRPALRRPGRVHSDEEITADVADLFNYITGFGRPRVRKLLVAPFTLRSGLVDEIRRVAAAAADGKHARIRLKLNHLVDPKIVEELYAASRAGAQVDIVARSTCALRPGVKGLSENIHVRSIVGRFLEHSRIYSFEADDRVATYIGSADLMQRNLDHRIEVLAPVENGRARQEVHAILDSALADDTNAWTLDAEGKWTRVVPEKPAKSYSHHDTMMRRSLQARTPRRS